jgi:ActD protein
MKFAKPGVYGLLAEFDSPEELVRACDAAYQAGYRKMDAYTPYPIEEVSEALGHHHSWLPAIVLGGGITGCLGGSSLAYWCSVIAYPMNIGGKPLNSWPAFIVPTFECTILVAALSAVLGMLALNGLPQPYHPAFNVDRFSHASSDAYFLLITARDKNFDRQKTWEFLHGLKPMEVNEVED